MSNEAPPFRIRDDSFLLQAFEAPRIASKKLQKKTQTCSSQFLSYAEYVSPIDVIQRECNLIQHYHLWRYHLTQHSVKGVSR